MMSRRQMIAALGGLGAVGAAGYFAMSGPDYDSAVASVWQPMEPRSNTDIEHLVHYATLAANSHNVQPWRFKVSAKGVSILPDLARATPVVDPDNHHLFASLGCACENLMLAAAAYSRSAGAFFVPDGDGEVHVDLAQGSSSRDPTFEAIVARQCTRSEYDGRPVSADILAALEKAATIEGCKAIFVSDRTKMDQILELILAGNAAQIGNPEFVKELKSWLRFNAASAVGTGDGLYSACSGNPTMPTWLGRTMFDFVFTAKAENEKCAKQVRSSSGLVIFVADKNDKEHWVKAGRSYQRFALQATVLGLKHAFLNQAVEVPEVRSQLAALLGIGDSRPNLLIRFGYGNAMPRSMRRPLANVMTAA